MAEIWGIAAAAVVGAGAAAYGANKQAGAAENAQNISQQQYQNDVSLEHPYNQAGMDAQGQLNYLLGTGPSNGVGGVAGQGSSAGGYGSLLSPFTADMMKQYSPAYQFQLSQGRTGVLNGASSGQGALGGAALQGLTDYNQSEANTAFASANNIYQGQQTNIYNRLAGVANQGQAAASGTAVQGSTLAGQAAQSAQNVGNAYASGANGVANSAMTGALYANYGGGGSSNPNSYVNSNGQNVYTGVTQNGGLGGGVGNLVDDV